MAPRWAALEGWFVAMETQLPAYSDSVMGDAYSWAALVGTFQRMFSVNATEASPDKAAEAAAVIKRADNAARDALNALQKAAINDFSAEHRASAAYVVVGNREAIVADAVNAQPESQLNLKRLADEEEDEDEDARRLVDYTLREACRRLVDLPEDDDIDDECIDSPADAAMVAQAARYVAGRICVPRDMGKPAASALRSTLMKIASESENYAWANSGGLL